MSLEDEMRQTLAEMSLIQYGRTQAFDASGGKSESPDPRPSGESWTLEDKWRDIWQHAPEHATLEAARDELRAWKVRQAPAETDDSTLEDWVVEDGEGYAVAQVASKFGIAETRVRRIRARHDREPEFGLETQALVPSASKEQRVVHLTDRGLSSREVATQVGLHKTQVLRILARLRNAA